MNDELSVLQALALARPLPPSPSASTDGELAITPKHRSQRKAQQAQHALDKAGRISTIRSHAKEKQQERLQRERADRRTRKVKTPPPPLTQQKTRVLKAQLRRAYHETQTELARLNSQIQPLSAEQHAQAVADITALRMQLVPAPGTIHVTFSDNQPPILPTVKGTNYARQGVGLTQD